MAVKPSAAPAPTDDEDQTEGMEQGGADEGEQDEGSDEPRVLLTVMCNPDGSYTVIKGDEDDEGGGSPEGEGAEGEESEGEEEEAPEGGEGGEGEEAGAEQGTTYHSVGETMKAILDIFREDEASQGGEDQFAKGYGESATDDESGPTITRY